MSQIKISCVGSTAVFTNTPDIYSGGNVDEVKFEFDKEWVDFTIKTAVFYTNPKETDVKILDTNDVAKIPPKMLAKNGKLSIGVIGTNTNGDIKTSKILTYIVGKGAVTDDMETTAPTTDIWLQLLSIVKHNKDVVDAMELIVDESQMPNKANKDLSNVSVDDLANKGMVRIITGTYTGDGESVRTIDLGISPDAVLLFPNSGAFDPYTNYGGYNGASGLALKNHPIEYSIAVPLKIVENGFEIAYKLAGDNMAKVSRTNAPDSVWYYIAFIGGVTE